MWIDSHGHISQGGDVQNAGKCNLGHNVSTLFRRFAVTEVYKAVGCFLFQVIHKQCELLKYALSALVVSAIDKR